MTHREQFITDVVNHYIKNNKEEYKLFLSAVKKRKKKKNSKADFNQGRGRHLFSLPEGLYNALDCALENPRFAREDKEAKWFSKKFPQFMLPYEY